MLRPGWRNDTSILSLVSPFSELGADLLLPEGPSLLHMHFLDASELLLGMVGSAWDGLSQMDHMWTEHLGWQGSPQHPQCGRQQNPCPRAKHTGVGTCCSTSTAPALSRRGFKVPLHFLRMKVPPLIDCTSLAISCVTESSSLKSKCLSTGGQENEKAIRAPPASAHLHGC